MTSVRIAEHGPGVSERDHRLLEPGDRRLGAERPLSRDRGDRGHSNSGPGSGIGRGQLTLGTDNGSALTCAATRPALSGLGIAHRRGGYRDRESQAFVDLWLRYLKPGGTTDKQPRPVLAHLGAESSTGLPITPGPDQPSQGQDPLLTYCPTDRPEPSPRAASQESGSMSSVTRQNCHLRRD